MVSFFESSSHRVAAGSSGSLDLARPSAVSGNATSDWIHAAQHLSFFLTAVLFWLALYGVGRRVMDYGAATLYVFATALHCSALGALLTFSTVLRYPVYASTIPRWRMTALQDQALGGVMVWVPSGLVFIVIRLILFASDFRSQIAE
jgi:putative membrane protein